MFSIILKYLIFITIILYTNKTIKIYSEKHFIMTVCTNHVHKFKYADCVKSN